MFGRGNQRQHRDGPQQQHERDHCPDGWCVDFVAVVAGMVVRMLGSRLGPVSRRGVLNQFGAMLRKFERDRNDVSKTNGDNRAHHSERGCGAVGMV
jgi:hypothetical protein